MSRRLKSGIAAVVGICVCVAAAWWVWDRVIRRCGWADDQITACARPFTAADARAHRVTFEIVVGDVQGDRRNVRFAVINNTAEERSLEWIDVRLRTADGEVVTCYWGDDSVPRLGPLPNQRLLSERFCPVRAGDLTLLYRGVEVARAAA